MEQNFQSALAHVLKHEGGWADHPKDPGGATMKGVTLATFRRYVKPKASKADLRKISDVQIQTVYRRHYWDAVRGNELPSGVDYAVFDFAVNSGPSRAIKFLQAVIGVTQDGRIGPATMGAVQGFQPGLVVDRLCDNRLAWLKKLKTWKTFGRGWGRRVEGVRSVSLSMAEISPDSSQETPQSPESNLTYVNQNAIRNRKVTPSLESNISQAIIDVFGDGYRGEIYSGGQPRKGSGGKRTGSVRHDDLGNGGQAADVRVYSPDNQLIDGLELAKLGQYWLVEKLGGCGLQMRGGGIHLDQWTTPPKGGGMLWTYKYSDGLPWGAQARQMLVDGHSGVLPELAPKTQLEAPKTQPKANGWPSIIGGAILAVLAALGFEVSGGDISDYVGKDPLPISENEESQ